MLTWAEKEVELACAREAPERKEGAWDYGCACYESALKAYKSLMEDGHSGYSINITKDILLRLIDHKPLTPIEDTPDMWKDCSWVKENSDIKTYQCSRMGSLFKTVHPDGHVTYSDNSRVRVTCASNPGVWWSDGRSRMIIDEMFPITMPYWPDKSYDVYAEDFLVDPANGDFDTIGYFHAIDSDGEKIEIDRYFGEVDGKFVEINLAEYIDRRRRANDQS